MRSILATCAGLALVSTLLACRPPAGGEGSRVESPGLGIAIATLPQPFELATAEGAAIELAAPGRSGTGRVVIAAGPPQTAGVNLVAEVKARQAAFESLPGGEYFGNRELVTPLGTAFTARGSYDDGEGGRLEETWVYMLHPAGDRALTIRYTYPGAAESKERVDQLLALVGEIEPLEAPPAGTHPDATPAPAPPDGGGQR